MPNLDPTREATIPAEKVTSQIGKIVHVAGWNRGCQFRLVSIDGDMANLVTPKTGKTFRVKASMLEYTNRNKPSGEFP